LPLESGWHCIRRLRRAATHRERAAGRRSAGRGPVAHVRVRQAAAAGGHDRAAGPSSTRIIQSTERCDPSFYKTRQESRLVSEACSCAGGRLHRRAVRVILAKTSFFFRCACLRPPINGVPGGPDIASAAVWELPQMHRHLRRSRRNIANRAAEDARSRAIR